VGSLLFVPKEIYYDTAQIREKQDIKIKICPDCPGITIIDSIAQPGGSRKSRAIILPHNTCNDCLQTGYDEYEVSQKNSNLAAVYLQDKVKDEFKRA
jgi:hypothetical protein